MENALTQIKSQLAVEVSVFEYLTIRVPDFLSDCRRMPLSKLPKFLISGRSMQFYSSFLQSCKLLCFPKRNREWMASASNELLAMLLSLEGDAVQIKRISAWISILAAYRNVSISAEWVELELMKGPDHALKFIKILQSKHVLHAIA
jgi:hypothetical protein